MRHGGGKNKGSSFERKVCAQLSLWVSRQRREDCYWRAAMSGGRATLVSRKKHSGRNIKNVTAQSGDISATHQLGNLLLEIFTVECKHVKDLGIVPAFYGKQGALGNFWQQVKTVGKEHDRIPLLIAKMNFQDEIICTTTKGAEILSKGGPIRRLIHIPRWDMCVYPFGQILVNVDWHKIRVLYEHEEVIKSNFR